MGFCFHPFRIVFVIAFLVVTAGPGLAANGERVVGDFGYAGMSSSDTLVVFDLATGSPLSPSIDLLPEGDYPYDVTMHPAGHEVWVVGASGDGVVVVETATNTVHDRIAMGTAGEYPVDIVFGLNGDLAYVSSRDSEAVVVVDVATHTLTGASIPIVSGYLGPGKMAVNPMTGEIYVVDWYDDELHVIDPISLTVTTEIVGSSMWDLTVNSTGSTLYIADRGSDQVHVVNTSDLSTVTSISVGDDPWGLDLTPDGTLLFVANEDSHNVTVIDTGTNTVATTIALTDDADPRDVDITVDGSTAYVPTGTITGDDGVFVIDVATLMVVDTFTFAGDSNGNSLAVAPQIAAGAIFADGFESGDTTSWSVGAHNND